MTTTRRKSKAAAEQDSDPAEGPQALTLTLPEDIDEDSLSDLLPDTNLTSISSEDVVALYRLLVNQAINLDATERERDEARGELERKDVELDQVLQDKESSAKDLEASVETVQEELNQVKKDRDQLGSYKRFTQSIHRRSYLSIYSRRKSISTDQASHFIHISILNVFRSRNPEAPG